MSNFCFPSEVIAEILHRLPLKSVVKCISVCKTWKSIITNDTFIASHHQHLQTNHADNSSLFLQLQCYKRACCPRNGYDESHSLYLDDDATIRWILEYSKVEIIGTCNGLVCFSENDYDLDDAQLVIWNPLILKYVLLPKPSLTLKSIGKEQVFCGFGFDSPNHDFKVLRFIAHSTKEDTPPLRAEIYSLASHSWRTISPFHVNQTGVSINSRHKFVNGVMHWAAQRKINKVCQYFILTFDVVEEKFGELTLPQCLKESPELFILTGGNLLAVFQKCIDSCHQNSCRIIWVMKEYGNVESWTQFFHFYPTSNYTRPRVLALRNSGEVVLATFWGDKVLFLDPIEGLVKKLDLQCCDITFVDNYGESLYLINEKKRKNPPFTFVLHGALPFPSTHHPVPSRNTSSFGKLKSVCKYLEEEEEIKMISFGEQSKR